MKKMKFLRVLFILPLVLLASCVDDFFQTPFEVVFPHNNGKYIGDQIADFTITYNRPVTSADIYLNGSKISSEFNYGPLSATAPIERIRKYLREGDNTLIVDPLAFGPTIKFIADTKGPEILIKDGKVTSGTNMRIKGTLRDASGISSLEVFQSRVIGIKESTGEVDRVTIGPVAIPVNQDKTFDTTIDISQKPDIYTFVATDIHGFETRKEYLANSGTGEAMKVSNAMRMAIGDTLVASLRPFIASSLFKGLEEVPIHVKHVCWNDPNKTGLPSQNPNGGFCASGQDGSTFPPGLNPVRMSLPVIGNSNAIIEELRMVSPNSTVLLNEFTVSANDRLYLNMDITNLTVGLTIKTGGFLGDLPMTMDIAAVGVDTGTIVSVVNKRMHVVLVDSNFELKGITMSRLKIFGIEISGLAGIFIPLLEGVIADLLPDILNPILEENLQKVVIGGKMLDQEDLTKEYFEWALNVETIKTDNTLGGAFEMLVGLETVANVLTVDPNITNQALGSIYVEDPIDISQVYNAQAEGRANISFALSSNALNQAFVALYNTGLSHFSLVDGVMTYGADPTKPIGTKDKTRIRLYPEAPPFFILKPLEGAGGASAASIGYESAVMYLDKHDGAAWKNQLELRVSLSIAASIDQEDQVVQLGIHGSPTLDIHNVVNNTALPITDTLLQTIVDAAFVYFIPTLNQNVFRLDMSKLADQNLNGTRVYYRWSDDSVDMSKPLIKRSNRYSFTAACAGAEGCVNQDSGSACDTGAKCYKHVCDTLNNAAYSVQPGKSLTCQTIDFEVSTNTVSSIGAKGTNLFFQMQANEKGFVVPPGMPRFDMDNDGIKDFRDNCSVPRQMLEAAVQAEGGLTVGLEGDAGKNINDKGQPINDFENRLKGHINKWIAYDLVGSASGITNPGNYILNAAQDNWEKPVGTAINPLNYVQAYPSLGNRSLVAWWDYMRKGDLPIADSLASDDYPWITMRYSNIEQRDTDGDGIGELCEDDEDRDGIYTDNGNPLDTCTQVYDTTNNPGRCTIDAVDNSGEPVFVLFKNKQNGLCLTHNRFRGIPTNTGGLKSFAPGSTADGQQLQWATCNTADDGQRFYIEVANVDPRQGTGFKAEKVIYIYTNAERQINADGFYNGLDFHFLATTIPNAAPSATSSYWEYDDIIVTGMPGYGTANNGSWRQWVLSLSYDPNDPIESGIFNDYPYLIESMRIWDVYGGDDATHRNCIFYKDTNPNHPDMDKGSCFPGDNTARQAAAFDVLLGPSMTKWRGRFSTD